MRPETRKRIERRTNDALDVLSCFAAVTRKGVACGGCGDGDLCSKARAIVNEYATRLDKRAVVADDKEDKEEKPTRNELQRIHSGLTQSMRGANLDIVDVTRKMTDYNECHVDQLETGITDVMTDITIQRDQLESLHDEMRAFQGDIGHGSVEWAKANKVRVQARVMDERLQILSDDLRALSQEHADLFGGKAMFTHHQKKQELRMAVGQFKRLIGEISSEESFWESPPFPEGYVG